MMAESKIYEGLTEEEAEHLADGATALSEVVMEHLYLTLGSKSVAGIEMDEVLEAFSMSFSAAIVGLLVEAGKDIAALQLRIESLENRGPETYDA